MKISFLAGILLLLLQFVVAQSPMTLDTTFRSPIWWPYPGSGYPSTMNCVYVEDDGRMVIGGHFEWPFNGNIFNFMARLNPDGSWDSTFVFDSQLVSYYEETSMIKRFNNKYYIVTINDRLLRIHLDGTLDTAFRCPFGYIYYPNTFWTRWLCGDPMDLYIFPDGKILLSGYFRINCTGTAYNLLRLNADGSFDSTFTPVPTRYLARTLTMLPNGSFYQSGNHSDTLYGYQGIWRRFADGTLDTTFHTPFLISDMSRTTLLDSGKIMLSGWFYLPNLPDTFSLVRLNSDGSIDSSFQFWREGPRSTSSFLSLTDNKTLVGVWTYINTLEGVPVKGFAVLKPDGQIDTSYFKGQGIEPYPNNPTYNYAYINRFHNYGGDKILACGLFYSYEGWLTRGILRLHDIDVGVPEQPPNTVNRFDEVKVFPVPATNEFTVSFPDEFTGEVVLYTISGQRIRHARVYGQREYTMDSSVLPAGLYILRIRDQLGNSFARKVVVGAD